MHVDVIIPTWDRPKLLRETIDSFMAGTHKDVSVFVVIDGNSKLIPKVSSWPVAVLYNRTRKDWIYSMNRALKYTTGDAVFYGSDDLVCPPTLLAEMVAAMKKHFPDGDGLIGIKTTPTSVQGAFGLMGKKFIEHFPDRQTFCPDFTHYASDFEIGRYARRAKKFFFCESVVIKHKRRCDETTQLAWGVKADDKGVSKLRRGRSLIWGITFDRVTEAAA